MNQGLWAWVVLILSGCGLYPKTHHAPVEILYHSRLSRNQYRVQAGDNLYSIAWAYRVSMADLARHNHLHAPYALAKGQILDMRVPVAKAMPTKPQPHRHPQVTHHVATHHPHRHVPLGRYRLPVIHGHIRPAHYPYHGVFVQGPYDHWVRAAHAGRVVYSGDGIKGYGHMLLIASAHHGEVIAYAFHHRNVVHAGQQVKLGQPIAKVGRLPSGKSGIYVELRRANRPLPAPVLAKLLQKHVH